MLIKFLKHGKGSGKAAINYLMGEKDHKGEVREGVKVLRGDPYLIADLIDSLDTIQRYTSGVIAFHPDDMPTDDQIQQVVQDFERVSFAGMEADQYTYCVVEHLEKDGGKHLHIIVPRVELLTGNAMNIAPPGHEKFFSYWRDYWNCMNGWRSPADINLVRSPKEKGLPEWKFKTFNKEVLQEFLVGCMKDGLFKNRDELINFLGRHGEVTRTGKDYISFKQKGDKKSIRLKGALFSDGWTFDGVIEDYKPQPDINKAALNLDKLQPLLNKKAEYNRSRYVKPVIIPVDFEKDVEIYVEADRSEERIAAAIEESAELNRIAEAAYREVEQKLERHLEAGRIEQIASESERAVARTKQAVGISESRIVKCGGIIEKLRIGIESFGAKSRSLIDGVRNFSKEVFSMIGSVKLKDIELAMAARGYKEHEDRRKEKEKKVHADDQELAIKIHADSFKELSELAEDALQSGEKIKKTHLELFLLQLSIEQQERIITEGLVEAGYSPSEAKSQFEYAATSGEPELQRELVAIVAEEALNNAIASLKNTADKSYDKSRENERGGPSFDGPGF